MSFPSSSTDVPDELMQQEYYRRCYLAEVISDEVDVIDVLALTHYRILWILPGHSKVFLLADETGMHHGRVAGAFIDYEFSSFSARLEALRKFLLLASRVNGVLCGARVFDILDRIIDCIASEIAIESSKSKADIYEDLMDMVLSVWWYDFGCDLSAQISEQRERCFPSYFTAEARRRYNVE